MHCISDKMWYNRLMNALTELYSAADLAALERKNRRRGVCLLTFVILALAACVTLCALTNMRNAQRMELAVITVSTVCGWAAIYCGSFVYGAGKKEAAHARRMLEGERSAYTGEVTVSDRPVRIRGSICVYPVTCRSGAEAHRLHLNTARAADLPGNTRFLTVYAVNHYIVAYEESHADA